MADVVRLPGARLRPVAQRVRRMKVALVPSEKRHPGALEMGTVGAAFVRIFAKELRQAGFIEPDPATANDQTWTR